MILIPTFIGYFVTSIVIALIATAITGDELVDGVALGVTLGVGFGIVSAVVNQMYEQKGKVLLVDQRGERSDCIHHRFGDRHHLGLRSIRRTF